MNGTTASDKNVEAMLTEQRKFIDEAKLQALEEAARQGWADITAVRSIDLFSDGGFSNGLADISRETLQTVDYDPWGSLKKRTALSWRIARF